jgi:NAD(P)-dependent dehydrogenase (short-subunit alcohol dehydrogenase family)
LNAAGVVDTVLETAVVPSFTSIGYSVRSRLEHWTELTDYRLDGRVVLVTGATSGLGRAACETLGQCGATVVVHGRDAPKTELVCREVAAAVRNGAVHGLVADLSELDAVRHAAQEVLERFDRLDVVIHNAGALHATRRTTDDGIEATVAVQVVAPFLLTALLLGRLRQSPPGRVLTMSSGGMYTAPLTVAELEMDVDGYRGTDQYARAKRAQVTLNEMWAGLVPPDEAIFHAAHPGWADTPGVRSALPRFRRLTGPWLRDAYQGADTIAWLAADDTTPRSTSGGFWHDRRRRDIHRLGRTRRSDTAERRRDLWSWCVERSGVDPRDGL